MAQLLPKDLFIVQLDDSQHGAHLGEVASVKLETLSDAIVPELATQPTDLDDPATGSAGIVMPGSGIDYDPATGMMNVIIPSGTEFVSTIVASDPNMPNSAQTAPVYTLESDGSSPIEKGMFYIVGETGLTLPSADWNLKQGVSDQPNLGDIVIATDVVDPPTGFVTDVEWDIIPNVTGGQAVLQVRGASREDTQGNLNLITIDENNPNIPIVYGQIANGDGTDFYGGLLNKTDYQKVYQLDTDQLRKGWVKDLAIETDSVDILSLTVTESEDNDLDDPVYKVYELGIEKGDKTQFGAVKYISDADLDTLVGINDTQAGAGFPAGADETAVTASQAKTRFIPRNFKSLRSLELSTN